MTRITVIFLVSSFLALATASFSCAATPIKIAAIFAKTGPASTSTIHHFQAARYAVDELNASGGLLGRKIELIEFNNESSPIKTRQVAMEAVRKGVVAVIGSSWSDHSIAAAKVLQKRGIPMISPDSTNPKVTRVGNYIFRVGFVDTFQGKVLADFAALKLQAKNAVIIQSIDSAYSMGLSRTFQKEFKAQGSAILGVFDYKQSEKDFFDILKKSKELKPELLFIPGYDECGLIVKQAQQLGLNSIMLGGDGWSYREFFAKGGMELKRGYYTCQWSKDLANPESMKFVKDYQEVYELNESAALTYDAVMLLAEAIRNAGELDRAKIRDALSSLKNFSGVTGTISLNEEGDPDRQAVVMEVIGGRSNLFTVIEPNSNKPNGIP